MDWLYWLTMAFEVAAVASAISVLFLIVCVVVNELARRRADRERREAVNREIREQRASFADFKRRKAGVE